MARKLLIIARNAGFSLCTDEVDVQGLVPEPLRALDTESFLARLEELDEPLAKLHTDAKSHGCVLRFLARLNQRGRARVGLVEVPLTHPAARLYGTDNQFAHHHPLQHPAAGDPGTGCRAGGDGAGAAGGCAGAGVMPSGSM